MSLINELQNLVDKKNKLEQDIKSLSTKISDMLTEKLKDKEYYYQDRTLEVNEPNVKVEKVEIHFTTTSFVISILVKKKLGSGKWSSKLNTVPYSMLEEKPIKAKKLILNQDIF